jgi:hypothetical protein
MLSLFYFEVQSTSLCMTPDFDFYMRVHLLSSSMSSVFKLRQEPQNSEICHDRVLYSVKLRADYICIQCEFEVKLI